jgi:site-specific recombinase XerD
LGQQRRRHAGALIHGLTVPDRRACPAGRHCARRAGRAAWRARVSPHALRHAYATHLLQGGADVRHVQELLGHKRIETTALYARVDASDLKAMLVRSHPRERRGRRPRR